MHELTVFCFITELTNPLQSLSRKDLIRIFLFFKPVNQLLLLNQQVKCAFVSSMDRFGRSNKSIAPEAITDVIIRWYESEIIGKAR